MQGDAVHRLISSALFPDEQLLGTLLEGANPAARLASLRTQAAKTFGSAHPRTLALDVLRAELQITPETGAAALSRLHRVLQRLQTLFIQKIPLEHVTRAVLSKLLVQQGAMSEALAVLPSGFPYAELGMPASAALEIAALYAALGVAPMAKPLLEKAVAAGEGSSAKPVCKVVLALGEEDLARKKQLLSEALREMHPSQATRYPDIVAGACKEFSSLLEGDAETDPAERIEGELLIGRFSQNADGGLALKQRKVELLIEKGSHEEALAELQALLPQSATGDPGLHIENLLRAGELAFALNKAADAETLLRDAKSRALNEPTLQEKAALACHNLGSLLLIQDKAEEARAELEAALQLHERGGESQSLAMADTLFALGLMHKNQGKDLEAVPYVSRAYSIRAEKLGSEAPLTTRTASLLQQLQVALQDVTAANDKARDELLALERARQFVESDNPGEALQILEVELKRREAKYHLRHPELLPVLRLAAEAYEKLGFLPQAKAFRMRVLELETEVPKPTASA